MSNAISGNNEEEHIRSTYVSSKHFQDKVILINRKSLLNRENIFIIGDILISRFTGVRWKSYKLKLCALEKKGRLYIYSKKSNKGLSLNLSELKLKESYMEKITSKKQIKAKCEIYLSDDKGKLCLCLKGSKNIVAKWRCGLVSAHKSILLGSAEEVDEIVWTQSNIDKLITKQIVSDYPNTWDMEMSYTNEMLSRSLPPEIHESFMDTFASHSETKYCSLTFDPRFDSKLMSPSKLSAALSRRSSTSIPFHSIKEDPSEWQEDITSLNLNKTDMAAFVTCHEDFYVHEPFVSNYVPGISMLSASIIRVDKFSNLQSSMESLNLRF